VRLAGSALAGTEWPPSSKKSSCTPTFGSLSTSANRLLSNSSCGVRAARLVTGSRRETTGALNPERIRSSS
jgi:hypothetical protein